MLPCRQRAAGCKFASAARCALRPQGVVRRKTFPHQKRPHRLFAVTVGFEEPDPKELDTLAAAWRAGDVARRWEVLSALLERIHVRQDRKVAGYTPRLDRANRVRLLIGTALDAVYGWSESEAEAKQRADGPGADFLMERSGTGAGGISLRTSIQAHLRATG